MRLVLCMTAVTAWAGVITACCSSLASCTARQGYDRERDGLCAQHTGANTPEVKSLKEGEYVGVRRFTRILERGTEAKSDLDKVIDRCGGLVNLRTAIMRYRKPRRWFRFYRSHHPSTQWLQWPIQAHRVVYNAP